jgi:hypothetical protein
MSTVRWSAVAWSVVGLTAILAGAPWVHAHAEALRADRQRLAETEAAARARVMEARRLVDAILEQRQAAIARDFGPGYREIVLRALADVPLEALRQIESDGGEGDLRAAIEAARTASSSERGEGDDLLLLPARVSEPSAVSGVATSGAVFVPVTPCRILDTRVAGGPLVPGSPRSFVVTGSNPTLFAAQGGNPTGCGIPTGTAVAAFVNFFSVSPSGPGHLRSWAYAATLPPAPFAAILTYASVPGPLNIANGVTAPLCDPLATTCTYDILAQAFGSSTEVVADVLGYFRKPPTSFATTTRTFFSTTVGTGCTSHPGGIIFVDAPWPGRVLVQTNTQLRFDHTAGALDTVVVSIGSSPTDCSTLDAATARMFSEPTGFYYPTVTPARLFYVNAPGSYYYYVNAFSSSGVANDAFWEGRIQATYHPE